MITKIRKRDGREIYFAPEKITRAIFLAASKVAEDEGQVADYATAEQLTDQVVNYLNRHYQDEIPNVEEIQDAVVKILIECGHAKTSEAYILYRAERTRIRNMKSRLMQSIKEITFSDSKDADVKRENANIDGNTAMGTMLQYGSAVSREFCKANLMTPKFAKLHDDGDIHIHDMDFMNMLQRSRLESKKISKTRAVTSVVPHEMDPYNVHIGPSDYVAWLDDRKFAFVRLEGTTFGDVPLNLEYKLEVWDSPNSAGIVIDALRAAKIALDRGLAGPILAPSSYFMKSPAVQHEDNEARQLVEEFIAGTVEATEEQLNADVAKAKADGKDVWKA